MRVDYTEVASRVESLKERIRKTDAGCWEWAGKRGANGYGYVYHRGREYLAHRVFYTGLVGSVDPDLDLDHLCRNRPCVNPAHLDPVTRRVNLQRGFAARGPKAHCKYGHSLADAYTYSWGRCCRPCAIARAAAAREQKQEEVS